MKHTDKTQDPATELQIAILSVEDALNQKLAAYSRKSREERPHISQAYDRLVARLAILDRDGVGPAVGERMPEFLMPDQSGKLVSLSSFLQRGPLIVSFNRGHWCPYCKLDLRELSIAQPQIERLGARIVSIMPDSPAITAHAVAMSGVTFPILSDVDLGYALSIGLIYWIGDDIKQLYDEIGIELERYHGNDGHFLPLAAKFVVDRNGLVAARQVNIEFRQRMAPVTILAALQALRDAV